MRVILTITIDKSLKRRLEAVADRNDRSMAAEARLAIEAHVGKAKANAAARKGGAK